MNSPISPGLNPKDFRRWKDTAFEMEIFLALLSKEPSSGEWYLEIRNWTSRLPRHVSFSNQLIR